jgi:hypothetical protein
MKLCSGMWRSMTVAVMAAALAGGCGTFSSTRGGDCSGGSLSGDTCVPYPGVHWTKARATAAALAFDYAPMVKGKLVEARCRIVARFHYSEAESLCKAVFVTPSSARRRVVVAFALGGTGAVNPDCHHHWKSSPYCSARGQPIVSGT